MKTKPSKRIEELKKEYRDLAGRLEMLRNDINRLEKKLGNNILIPKLFGK